MERPQLLPEIWSHVFQILREPLPLPNGKNERSSIRQPGLALFNQLAACPLYTIVVCDDLSYLVERINRPAAAQGIPSKAELLSYMDRLFLEYGAKSEPSYSTLMRGNKFGLMDPSWEITLQQCGEEAARIVDGLAKLFKVMTKPLSTLSTGAFLGGQKDIWERVWNIPEGHPGFCANVITRARENLADLLHFPGAAPPAFCSRTEFGPLIYISTIWNNAGPNTPGHRFRSHVNSELGVVPAVVGGNSRWYCTLEDSGYPGDVANMVGKTVGQVVWAREGLRQSLAGMPERRKEMEGAPFLTTELYLPRNFVARQKDFRLDAVIKYVCERHEIDINRTKGDQWIFKAIETAPKCEACGWRIGDQTRKVQQSTLPNLDFRKIPIGERKNNDAYHNWRAGVGETELHTLRPANARKPIRDAVFTKPQIQFVPTIE